MIILQIFIINLLGFQYITQDRTIEKIPEGYYYGSDKLFTNVFVKIVNDTAIIDFILIQKYPRELLNDTLLYNSDNQIFLGRISNLRINNDIKYVCNNEMSLIFGKNIKIRIKQNKAFYEKHIDEYKNYAVWYEFYKKYIDNYDNKEDARRYFQDQEKKYKIKLMLDTLKHKDFVEELEKFKNELKSP